MDLLQENKMVRKIIENNNITMLNVVGKETVLNIKHQA